jgi:hypothetical protein
MLERGVVLNASEAARIWPGRIKICRGGIIECLESCSTSNDVVGLDRPKTFKDLLPKT